MSKLTRLTLVCRGATEANRKSIFGLDASLLPQEAVRATLRLAAVTPRPDMIVSAPEAAARETAGGFGQDFAIEPALADLDYGRWTGKNLMQLAEADPAALQSWLHDPQAAPHGGESLGRLQRRAQGWLAAQGGRGGHIAAVTHSAVIRALALAVLDAPLAAFWRIDIDPLAVSELRNDGRRWVLHSLGA
ncbi:histidine phosphatase family protein [Rhizobium sp. YJ-22]|uniref:histidine phosphatase family protein n=1 Tax=Rhizobium sp. YJ-22 TaxID=3037556 RepID=UPI0024128228|nr:histidine phosphatase family protein [Rhizobium sp. YJ-22]MDG3576437.1 histidine phosphatase family protein [Rhizobium sp. YJ-22]